MYTVEQIKTACNAAWITYQQSEDLIKKLKELPQPGPQQLLQQTPCTTLLICHECENHYPHSHTDGSYSCEDCGHKWAN